MNFTPVKRNLIKIFSLLSVLLLLPACGGEKSEEATEALNETPSETQYDFTYTQTEDVTNYVKLTMEDSSSMIIELYPDIAPITVKNFQNLVSEKFYDGIIFHRVVPGFVIQAGDPTGLGSGGSDTKIKGEFGTNGVTNTLSHKKGIVSMARLGNDNDSATSQFFICLDDCSASLDGKYAAFGEVIGGMNTVDAIASVKTSNSRPVTEQKIASIRFVEVEK